MPLYVLSSISHIKDNVYKFGYSSKSKNDLLKQYIKNKRIIPNPFIIQWWCSGSIKTEKNIHSILHNTCHTENIDGEWYRCDNLLYLLKIIDIEINKVLKVNKPKIKNIYYDDDEEKEIRILSNIIIDTRDNEKIKIKQYEKINNIDINVTSIMKKIEDLNINISKNINISNEKLKKEENKTCYIKKSHIDELFKYINISYEKLFDKINGYNKYHWMGALIDYRNDLNIYMFKFKDIDKIYV